MRLGLIAGLGLAAATPGMAQEYAGPLGTAQQVTASYTFDLVPAPDGVNAVMIRIVGGHQQLFLTGLDGSGERQITFDDAEHQDPVWSPDGRTIAFVLAKGGTKRIHLIDPATGTVSEAVSPVGHGAIHPSFTPDGSEILYCTDDDLRPPTKNESEIYAVDPVTRQVRTVISGGVNTYPVMSPDGRTIALRKIIGDMNSEVFLADTDGANLRNLTNHHSWEGWPAWSPDGRTIAFAANRSAAWQIFLINPDGTNLRLLASTEGRGTAPKWSPDGRTIYYTICRRSQTHRGCDVFSVPLPAE